MYILIIKIFLGKKSQNLPAGVNERDVELFTVSQETAKNFLIQVK